MASNNSMIDVLVEETTTLPEGAQISVCRCKHTTTTGKRETVFTELRARRGETLLKMRVDDVGPSNVKPYLELIKREITRRRLEMTAPAPLPYNKPQTIADFVVHMAASEMFMFDAISTKLLTDEPNTTGDKKIPRTGGKTPGKRKRKDNQPSTG